MPPNRRGASHVDLARHRKPLAAILRAAAREPSLTPARLERILKDHPMDGRGLFPRDALVRAVAIAASRGFGYLAVISAVGTRAHCRRRGFVDMGGSQVREVRAR